MCRTRKSNPPPNHTLKKEVDKSELAATLSVAEMKSWEALLVGDLQSDVAGQLSLSLSSATWMTDYPTCVEGALFSIWPYLRPSLGSDA